MRVLLRAAAYLNGQTEAFGHAAGAELEVGALVTDRKLRKGSEHELLRLDRDASDASQLALDARRVLLIFDIDGEQMTCGAPRAGVHRLRKASR